MSLRDQLTQIYQSNKQLTSEILVNAATPEEHPLHGRFEWNDGVAGHEYRKVQAAELIRSVRVHYGAGDEGDGKSVRQWVSSTRSESEDRSYQPVEEVLADPFAQKLLLQECKREWKSFERKFGHLQEFARIVGKDAA